MKKLTAIIERNEDAFFAYVKEIEGCTAGGYSYEEVKENLEEMIQIFLEEDPELHSNYKNGYKLTFVSDIQSAFKLLSEINMSAIANISNINPSLLRQYATGKKPISEKQLKKVHYGLSEVIKKLESFTIAK